MEGGAIFIPPSRQPHFEACFQCLKTIANFPQALAENKAILYRGKGGRIGQKGSGFFSFLFHTL